MTAGRTVVEMEWPVGKEGEEEEQRVLKWNGDKARAIPINLNLNLNGCF